MQWQWGFRLVDLNPILGHLNCYLLFHSLQVGTNLDEKMDPGCQAEAFSHSRLTELHRLPGQDLSQSSRGLEGWDSPWRWLEHLGYVADLASYSDAKEGRGSAVVALEVPAPASCMDWDSTVVAIKPASNVDSTSHLGVAVTDKVVPTLKRQGNWGASLEAIVSS